MTTWKFTDDTETAVFRTKGDGSMESKLATEPDIVAAIAAEQVLPADEPPAGELTLQEQIDALKLRIEALEGA